MSEKNNRSSIFILILGAVLFVIGVLNLILVHPVPGGVFILVSLIYLPQVNIFLKSRFGFSIPPAVKIIIAIFLIWFTLGVSDLGDMIDSLFR